jgi:hypothetical protein
MYCTVKQRKVEVGADHDLLYKSSQSVDKAFIHSKLGLIRLQLLPSVAICCSTSTPIIGQAHRDKSPKRKRCPSVT